MIPLIVFYAQAPNPVQHPDITKAIELSKEADAQASAGQFEVAIKNRLEAINLIKRHGLTPPELVNEYGKLAGLYTETRQYDFAENALNEGMKLEPTLVGKQKEQLGFIKFGYGLLRMGQGRWDEAITFFEQTLNIEKEINGEYSNRLFYPYQQLGLAYGIKNNLKQAEKYYRQAIDIKIKNGENNNLDCAEIYSYLASLLNIQHRYLEENKYLITVLDIILNNSKKITPLIIMTRSRLALNYWTIGEYSKSELEYNNVLAHYNIIKNNAWPKYHDIQIGLGHVTERQDKLKESEQHFKLALESIEKSFAAEDPLAIDVCLQIARVISRQANYLDSVEYFERVRAAKEKSLDGNHEQLCEALIGLGGASIVRGRINDGEGYLNRAIKLLSSSLDATPEQLIMPLYFLALGLLQEGKFESGWQICNKVQEIVKIYYNKDHLMYALSQILFGFYYGFVGKFSEAEVCLDYCTPIILKGLGENSPAYATCLMGRGIIKKEQNQYREAEKWLKEALALHKKLRGPEHQEVSLDLYLLSDVEKNLGRLDEAKQLGDQALSMSINTLGYNHPNTSEVLRVLSSINLALGHKQIAADQLWEAVKIPSLWNYPPMAMIVILDYGKIQNELGHSDLAIFWGKQAINILQTLRGELRTFSISSQQAFLQKHEKHYAWLADLLIDQGRLAEAQQVLTMLKEEELFEFTRRDEQVDPRKTTAEMTGQEQSWQKRYQIIQARLAEIGNGLEEIRTTSKARGGSLTPNETAQKEILESDAVISRKAYDSFLADLMKEVRVTTSSERVEELGSKNLPSLQALQSTLKELGHGAVTVHYIIIEKRLQILLTTPTVQLVRTYPIGEKELNRKIIRFRAAIQDPEVDAKGIGKELFDILLKPIEEDLKQAKAGTLMLSLDGSLRYVPMAALWDGHGYSIERWAMVLYTEASRDRLKDLPGPNRSLLGLGLSQKVGDFQALPGVELELKAIAEIVPGKTLLNQAFTLKTMVGGLEAEPPILHISSHFVFKPGVDSDSFLLMGDGSHLTLRDIKDAPWTFGGVDLLSLSACETAVVGGRDENGREVEGFGALAQLKGAKGVLASLWSVADASTAAFMADLYRRWKGPPDSTKAEAMRQVQLAFIENRVPDTFTAGSVASATAKKRPKVDWSHPFYWAPFVLMGNWR